MAKKTISEILKDGVTKKLLIFSGIVVIAGTSYAFMTSKPPAEQSSLVKIPTTKENLDPFSENNPAYNNAIAEQNTKAAQEAKKSGQSFLPTIVGSGNNQTSIDAELDTAKAIPIPPEKIEKKEEPKPVTSPAFENKAASNVKPAGSTTPVQTGPVLNEKRVALYMAQMGDMMGGLTPKETKVNFVFNPDEENALLREEQKRIEMQQAASNVSPSSSSQDEKEYKLPLAGEIFYGQLVGKATSDAPGPVVAKILQGPYSGATLVGSFQTANEALVIKFSSMSLHEEGVTIPINAVAVDTKNIGTAMATNVDRHLMLNLGTTFVTSFIKGFGNAVTQSGSTTTENDETGTTKTSNKVFDTKDLVWSGLSETASESGEVLKSKFGNRPTTVEVDAGTPIGILFL